MSRSIPTLAAVALATAIAASGGLPEALNAQQWHLDLSGGRMASTLSRGPAVQSIAAGLRYDDPVTGLRLSAGLPTDQAEPLWGAIGGWRRLAAREGSFMVGADLSGNAFMTHDRSYERPLPGPFGSELPSSDATGSAVAGQAMAVLGYEGLDLHVHARAGASEYRGEFGGTTRDVSVRTADVQLTWAPTQTVALLPVARYFRSSTDAAMTFVGVSAVISQPQASLWASAGRFVDGVSDDAASSYGAGVLLRVQERLALQAGARKDAFDPLHRTPPQTSWSVGASLLIGGRAGPPPPPIPASYERGRATVKLPVSDAATAPSIAGDFNDWSPHPMQRDGDHWSYTVALAPGVYNYAFVGADGEWFVPESVPGRRDDGMGGHVAVLVVQ